MTKPFRLLLSCALAAGAIGALTMFAVEMERTRFDRSAIANLSGAPLDPTTTGSITPRDETGATYRKRVEHLDKSQLGTLVRAVAPAR